MKALTALLGYLNVLLEYINLYHSFQLHSKKDNFGVISFWTEAPSPPFLSPMGSSLAISHKAK